MKILASIVALECLIVLGAASNVFAQPLPDPTGVWTGRASCRGLDDGQKFRVKGDATLELTYLDITNELAGALDIANTIDLLGCGFVAAEDGVTNRGQAILHGLEVLDLFGSFHTVNITKLKVYPEKNGRSGKLKASIAVGDKGGETVLSCRMSAKRTSLVDPAVGVLCVID